MNLGARTAMWSSGAKPWVNPYTPKNYVAIWDCLDGEVTRDGWVDQINGLKLSLLSGVGLTKAADGGVQCNKSELTCFSELFRQASAGLGNKLTIEYVVDIEPLPYSQAGCYAISTADTALGSSYSAARFTTSVKRWSDTDPIASQYDVGANYWFYSFGNLFPSNYKIRTAAIVRNAGDITFNLLDWRKTNTYQDRDYPFDEFNIGFVKNTIYPLSPNNLTFYSIRICADALTDEELAFNASVDKARFGLT